MNDHSGLTADFRLRRSDAFDLDIQLAIEPGSTAALLGPNGSGKSTTVDAIAGLLPVDSGQISLAGHVLDEPVTDTFVEPARRGIGVVFQRYYLLDHLSVLDNVAFGPAVSGRSRRDARLGAQRFIDALDLQELSSRRPVELSGGQAQRVALARALATEPGLLLLDEPLAALDVTTRSTLRRTLTTHLSDFAGPRVLITHEPTDAFLLADRIHVLEAGRITQSGTPDEIRRRPATPYVAALAGLNFLTGSNVDGVLTLDDHRHVLHCSDTHTSGSVLITIHPTAIALHRDEPHGSPRNTWSTTAAAVEPLGEITRVTLAAPVPLSVDITPGAATAMEIAVGSELWVSIKATEVLVNPA